MKHITLFFCDIMNTFLGNKANSELDVENFVTNLKHIKEKNKSKILLFAFVSEEIPEEIEKLENYFSSFIDDPSIKLIANSKDCKLKTTKITDIIKNICQKYVIDEVYFADDCEIYHQLIEIFLSNFSIDVKINYILTKHGGITEINNILENKLKEKIPKLSE